MSIEPHPAEILPVPGACSCPEVAIAHWCGQESPSGNGPCCVAQRNRPWKGAKSLNHLRICHEPCWRADVTSILTARSSSGLDLNLGRAGHAVDGGGERLRLCHRRCYVQDLMRWRDYNNMSEVYLAWGREVEIVPCHQTLAEKLWWPAVQHWVARRMVVWRGARWKAVRMDRPWPRLCPWDERTILGVEKKKGQGKWVKGKEREEEGKGGEEKRRTGWWMHFKWWPFS